MLETREWPNLDGGWADLMENRSQVFISLGINDFKCVVLIKKLVGCWLGEKSGWLMGMGKPNV